MSGDLSPSQARRIFLNAQRLATPRADAAAGAAQFAGYLQHQGIVQLDTVNVFARAHYLPFFSRLGPFDPHHLDAYLWPTGEQLATTPVTERPFEHWGHEASVMPRDLLPALHHRMRNSSNWKAKARDWLTAERPGLIEQVAQHVSANGPATAGQLEHLAPRDQPRGTWWDDSHVKHALEYLFITGDVAASRGKNFSRTYNDSNRAWGLAPASSGDWGMSPEDGLQLLVERALAACGIGTVRDLADHFRLLSYSGWSIADVRVAAERAVARGAAQWVNVDTWQEPALIATGTPTSAEPWRQAAHDPGEANGSAILSPFDPVCWYRPRLLRMFGMDYRIEIYTPAAKRQFGYYCLPFLMGDQMVARVDLKADRKAKVLRVEAAWREDPAAPDSRPSSEAKVAHSLAVELRRAAQWQGLAQIEVADRGTLAQPLQKELRTA